MKKGNHRGKKGGILLCEVKCGGWLFLELE